MDNDKDTRKSGIWIIVGVIIIYILFMLWATERNKNKDAEAVFASQTRQAERDEYTLSYLATQTAQALPISQAAEATYQKYNEDNWFWDCLFIYDYDTAFYEGLRTCVIGQVVAVEKDDTSSNPTMYFTRFDKNPSGFFVYGTGVFENCIDCCVAVRGRIHITPEGAPFIGIADFGESDFMTLKLVGTSFYGGYSSDDVQFVLHELCQLAPESADGTPPAGNANR
ncbi:MAG: hypothetical protein ABIL11_15830 [Chloroflexota bacterium]